MRPPSFGVRLALLNAGVLAAAMLVLGSILFALVDRALVRGADGILRDETEEILRALREGPMTPASLAEESNAEVSEHRSESLAFRISGTDGRELARTASAAWDSLPLPGVGWDGAPSARTFRPEGEEYRHRVILRREPSVSFGPVNVEAVMRLRSADLALDNLREAALLLAPALLLVALAVGYFLARRALLPVVRMTTSARRIGTGPPGELLPQSGTGDEIDRLAETLNAMLGRIEEASERNLRFAADVAHEVRTPLATIRARLEAVPDGGDRVATAVREVERMEAMVRSLLLICRADEGAARAIHAPVDLSAEIREVAEFFGPAAVDRGIRLEADASPGLVVAGDTTALRRALSNLVDNALHGSDPGGEVILRGRLEGGLVRVEVLDRGCGVPEDSRERVFERFFRAPNGRARNAEGSGLGLALVRAVARSHGGEATYAPRPGGGSVFGLRLPPS